METIEDFTKLAVSTTTVTASLSRPINIVDVAKYLPIGNEIIGIKLVYAGGSSTIIRGVAKISKKKKDFYNQVTFTVRLLIKDKLMLFSCKIFHNGTLHVTGTHNLEEAEQASNMLLTKLEKLNGIKMISCIQDVKVPYLCSYDNVLFSTKGNIIGWCNGKCIYLKNEYVDLQSLDSADSTYSAESTKPVFVSSKWVKNEKTIYTLNGEEIGKRHLRFDSAIAKRHFEVKFGYIYSGSGNKIIGKEETFMDEDYLEMIGQCEKERLYLLERGVLLHTFDAYTTWNSCENEHEDTFNQEIVSGGSHDHQKTIPMFTQKDFKVHMINTFFRAPFKICRTKLHKTLLDSGYYSRFDPCSNLAVNLRFHYNIDTVDNKEERGKCPNRNKICVCKDISVSCFISGRINVTGLATIEQGHVVYDFLKVFFTEKRDMIESREDVI